MAKIGKDEQRKRDFVKAVNDAKQRYIKKYGKQVTKYWEK